MRTTLILFLAANTSFNAFPRLAAILAEDGYMPRQFCVPGRPPGLLVGHRAAGRGGVPAAVGSSAATRTLLIPLYSVGVFVCFTLSSRAWSATGSRSGSTGWHWRLGINASGAILTAVVLSWSSWRSSSAGAYLVVILIPLLVGMMLFINRQYARSTPSWRSAGTS